MKHTILLAILAILALTTSSTAEEESNFARHFKYVTFCYYNPATEEYTDNCDASMPGNNSFYINYSNTNDILYVASNGEKNYLRNLGVISKDDSAEVSVYNFLDADGDQLMLVWAGDWIRFVYNKMLMLTFTNEAYQATKNTSPKKRKSI